MDLSFFPLALYEVVLKQEHQTAIFHNPETIAQWLLKDPSIDSF